MISMMVTNSIAINSKVLSFTIVFFIFSILFIVQPFLTVALVLAFSLLNGAKATRFIYLIAFFGSCYLGLINATKLPESDYEVYLLWYSIAKELSLPSFLALYTREPIYYLFTYAIANINYSSEQFFVFISTVISYLIFNFAIIRSSSYIGLKNSATVAILVSLMVFSPLFSLSAHLMRQFIAASLVVLFYSTMLTSNKKQWWILVVAILIHSTALIFILLSNFRNISRNTFVFSLPFYIILVLFIYIAFYSFAFLFSEIPYLGFVFNRIASDSLFQLGSLSQSSVFFVMVMIALSFSILRASRQIFNASVSDGLFRINNTIIILSLVVLAADWLLGDTEVSTRIFFYLYFFTGLSIPIFIAFHKKFIVFLFPISLLLIFYFFHGLESGTWKYASLADLLFAPAWELWSHRL